MHQAIATLLLFLLLVVIVVTIAGVYFKNVAEDVVYLKETSGKDEEAKV